LKEIGNALADYNEAIRIDPTDARTFMNRGTARDWRGDIEEAIADYSEAIRIDPRGVDPYRYRAGARLKKEDHEGTLRDLDEVLRRAPGDPVAYYRRGEVWIKLGLPDKALFDLNEAIRLDPRMTEALSKRTTLYQERGEHGKAEADADRVRKIHATRAASPGSQKRTLIISIFREHFHPHSMDNLTITERQFPFRVRSDLQRATQSIFTGKTRVTHVCGVRQSYSHEGLDITGLITPNEHSPALSVPLEYEEIDIGEETPIRCPKQALWLLDNDGAKYAVLLCPAGQFGQVTGLKFQVAAVNDDRGTRITQGFFKHLEDSVLQSQSYRGKVLSLDARDMYSGRSSGILVHKLKNVKREEVILPRKTLDLLDRNVLSFSRQRGQLRKFGLSTKKGVLLYGPPGTGKTHTIHYLAGALPGHTTFLITAQQMGLLGEYMT
jgi:tetratricopeptide (TPR) repeat protein